MAAVELKMRTRIAWWVRPAILGVGLISRIFPSRVEGCIDFIVDKGIKVRPE